MPAHGTDLLVRGLLDEIGHLLTALVVVIAVRRWTRVNRSAAAVTLIAAVIIDIDHVPGELLGIDVLTVGTPRPVPA